MPTLSPLYADGDLEVACGGAYRLLELANAQSTADAAYTNFLAMVRRGAQTTVYGVMGIAFDPIDPTVAGTDSRAVTACISIAVFFAWFYGTGGQAVPQLVAQEKASAELALQMIRDGKSGLGTATEPANKSGARTVSIAGDPCAVIRRTLGGFC